MDLSDSILVTLSQQTIKDRRGGYRVILKEWSQSDGSWMIWYYKCGNAPKRDFVFIYWVIAGRIRYRCRILEIHKDTWMRFDNQPKPKYGKTWLACIDFEPVPRNLQLPHKGFQGFRYFNSKQIQF